MMKSKKWIGFLMIICCLPFLFIGCGDDDDDDGGVKIPVPTIPTGLKAQSERDGVVLTWQAGQNAARYRIYRSLQQDTGYELKGTSDQITFKDTNVTPDTTYFYKVAGVSPKVEGREIEGDKSPPVQVTHVIAVLTVEPPELDFGESEATKPLKIKNGGGAPLDWELSSDAKWVTFDLAKGTLAGKQEQVVVDLIVHTDRRRPIGVRDYYQPR